MFIHMFMCVYRYSNFMAWLLLTRHLWQFEPLILLKNNNIRSDVITFIDLIFIKDANTSNRYEILKYMKFVSIYKL